MVRWAEQADVESAELDLWSGVVGAVLDDGGLGLARLAKARLARGTRAVDAVCGAARFKCGLVVVLLWSQAARVGPDRHRRFVAGDRDDDLVVSHSQQHGCLVAGALSVLGDLRDAAESGALADELMRHSRFEALASTATSERL